MADLNPVLAKTSFETGVDESLATPDVYGGGAPTSPLGALRDSINSGTSVQGISMDALGGGDGGMLGGLSKILSSDMKTFTDQFGKYEQGIKAVTNILSGDKSLMDSLKSNMVGELLTSAGLGTNVTAAAQSLLKGGNPMDIVGNLARGNPNLSLIMNGVETIIAAKDVNSIEGLLAVAGKISGMEGLGKLLHIGPQLGIIKGLVDKANFLGIPALAKALTDTIKNPEDKKKVELGATLGAAQGSNLVMLEDIMARHGAAAVSGMYPLMVGQILSSYKYPAEIKFATVAEANKLVSICTQLEPDWLYEKRDGRQTISTRYLVNVSKDAKELLYLLNTTREAVMVAGKYPATSIMGLAQRQYPYTPMALT